MNKTLDRRDQASMLDLLQTPLRKMGFFDVILEAGRNLCQVKRVDSYMLFTPNRERIEELMAKTNKTPTWILRHRPLC